MKDIKQVIFVIASVVVVCVMIFGFSWLTVCGLIKLITMCFGWTFKWRIATGIWIIICILGGIFKANTNVKK